MAASHTQTRNVSLDQFVIKNPCPVRLETMPGGDESRFCTQCNLRVTNLSAMTRENAEAYIGAADGQTWVQYFKRPDGRVVTADDPLRWRLVRRLAQRMPRWVAMLGIGTVILNFLGGCGAGNMAPPEKWSMYREHTKAERAQCAAERGTDNAPGKPGG